MRRALLFAFCFSAFLWSPSQAQDFFIEQSIPSSGSVAVPLTDTVSFSFNRRVSLNTDFNREFVYEPNDSLTFNKASICLNADGPCGGGDDVSRHIRYRVRHQNNTDYTWLVYGVLSDGGRSMREPYTLRYTTASELGPGTVKGDVQSPATTPPTSASTRATLRTLARSLHASGRGQTVFSSETPTINSAPPASPDAAASAFGTIGTPKAASGPFTQILLIEDFSINASRWSVRAADALIGSSGSYQIDYVREGTYVPIAVRYTDGTSREIDALGFHDPDQDGEPDAVDVGTTESSGIDLQLFSFPLTTAGATANLAAAQDSAAQYASDPVLKLIEGGAGLRPSGTAYSWTYRFYSPSQDLETRVAVDPLDVTVDTFRVVSGRIVEMTPIPDSFTDTDAALQVVLDGGGQEFLDSFVRSENITTRITGGNQFWTDAPIPEEEFWRVRFIGVTSSRFEIFERYINIETGEFLPVELTDLTATASKDAVHLQWTTASETNNAGFEVQHSPPGSPDALDPWSSLGFVQGAGTTSEPQTYRFRAVDLEPGVHRFRLRQVDTDGTAHLSKPVRATVQMGEPLRLTAPAPNPANGRATLSFAVRQSQETTIALYNVLGQKMATLYRGTPASTQTREVQIDTAPLSSGLYIVRLQAGDHTQTRRLTVVK